MYTNNGEILTLNGQWLKEIQTSNLPQGDGSLNILEATYYVDSAPHDRAHPIIFNGELYSGPIGYNGLNRYRDGAWTLLGTNWRCYYMDVWDNKIWGGDDYEIRTFDGVDFNTVYTHGVLNGSRGILIDEFYNDLFFGVYGQGTFKRDNGAWNNISSYGESASSDHSGRIFCFLNYENRVDIWDGSSITTKTFGYDIRVIYCDGFNIYMGSFNEEKLYRYDLDFNNETLIFTGSGTGRVQGIFEAGGYMWVVTQDAVYRSDDKVSFQQIGTTNYTLSGRWDFFQNILYLGSNGGNTIYTIQ